MINDGQSGPPKCLSPLHRLSSTRRSPYPGTAPDEADRDAHGKGRGASSASNSGSCRSPSGSASSRDCPSQNLLPSNRPWAMAKAIGPASWRSAGGEGGSGICRDGAGAAQEQRPGWLPLLGEGAVPTLLIKRRCRLAGVVRTRAPRTSDRHPLGASGRSTARSERSGDRAQSYTGHAIPS